MYENCHYVYAPRDSDSISVDSLALEELEQEIELDQDGNPVLRPKEPVDMLPEQGNDNVNGEATEPKKKAQPEYEDVYF